MFKFWKETSDEEKNKMLAKLGKKLTYGSAILVAGYLVGRLTCVADLQAGKLDMLIPKK